MMVTRDSSTVHAEFDNQVRVGTPDFSGRTTRGRDVRVALTTACLMPTTQIAAPDDGSQPLKPCNAFTQHGVADLQGTGNLLAIETERHDLERDLRAALSRYELLLEELDHRIRNSLQLVASLLRFQARTSGEEEVRRQLQDAASRIRAVARAHQRLRPCNQARIVDLGAYLGDVCRDLEESAGCEINVELPDAIEIAIDRAIPIALIVNELIANAAKHADPGHSGCYIWVRLGRGEAGAIMLSVRDEGVGLAPDFDVKRSKGQGMRIVTALAQQLQAGLQVHSCDQGTQFALVIPADWHG